MGDDGVRSRDRLFSDLGVIRHFDLVVDSGAGIDWASRAEAYRLRYVRVERLDRNYGFCLGNNKGFERCSGETWVEVARQGYALSSASGSSMPGACRSGAARRTTRRSGSRRTAWR